LRQFGGAFLEGDWSGFDALSALQEKAIDDSWDAQAVAGKQWQAELAMKRAAVLFRAGNYAGTVEVLAPHEALLPKAELMRLRLARERAQGR
jgi:hypothetical protein